MSENERIKGNDYYRAGEMEESIISYTKSIMLNPVNAKVYANRAQARIRMNELDLALQDCNEAIKLNPAYTKALARRGMILQKKGRYEEAISDFSECCRLETASVYERFLERCKEKHEEEISRKRTTTTLKILEVDETEKDEVNDDGDDLDGIEEVYTPGALESQSEREYDKSLEEKERAWKLEEKKRLTGYYELYNVQEGGTIEPQPSLFVLVTFLVEKIRGLVEEICPCCKERVLPVDPAELNAMYGGSSHNDDNGNKSVANHHPKHTKKKKKPMRTYCGCWYHKCCLNTLLTEPPFGLSCPNKDCGQRVFHPDWPSDIKQLEREWAAKQARKREIEDAMMFL
mmetsp:Transcript_12402/g.25221  ORF Transcript_12402/g.25221 Transcript_12402/m.25221 type:complete len:345 (-) Transcript_12402:25-1059(-)